MQYLLDICAKVIMKDIPPSLVINWDETAIHLVPVSAWTMSKQGEQSIPIAGFDDKREITVILAVTLAGKYLYHLRFCTRAKQTVVIQQLSFHLSGMCDMQKTTGLMKLYATESCIF